MEIWNNTKLYGLPRAGGWADQLAVHMHIINLLDSAKKKDG